MSARLDSLIARNLRGSTALQARTPSLFEPASQAQGSFRSVLFQLAGDDLATTTEEVITGESHDSQTPSPRSLSARTEGTLNPSRKSSAPFNEAHHDPQPPRIDRSPLEPPARHSSERQSSSAISLTESLPPAHRSRSERSAHPAVTVGEVATSTPTPKPAPLATRKDRKAELAPLIGKVTPVVSKSERERENPSWLPARTTNRKPLRPADVTRPSSPQAAPEPTIQVTIGRIEIRAEREPSAPRKSAPTPPVMALDEYLRQKNARTGQ